MSGDPKDQDDGLGGPSIPTDPELEAALREAADAVEGPDEEATEGEEEPKEVPAAASPGDAVDALLLDDPLGEEDPDALVFRLREQLAEASDKMMRLQADFTNFRKRAAKERQEALLFGSQNLFKDLLSVVDNLDRAIGHARENSGGDLGSFLQGVELVRRELLGVFEKHHVTEIEAMGCAFDPALHEAMAQVEVDSAPPNTVVEVLEKGYQLRDRLVRPSRVVVAKAPSEPKSDEGEPSAG